jgi:hypothetical protein
MVIRTMAAKVQSQKEEALVVIIKGFDAKTN